MPSIPREVALFPEHRFALAQPRERVTGALVVEYGRAIAYHPLWEPGFTEVWDVTFSPAVDILPSDLPALTKLEKETEALLRGSRTVIVSSRTAVIMGANFYARLMRAFGRDVVSAASQEEAAELLGIDALPILGAG